MLITTASAPCSLSLYVSGLRASADAHCTLFAHAADANAAGATPFLLRQTTSSPRLTASSATLLPTKPVAPKTTRAPFRVAMSVTAARNALSLRSGGLQAAVGPFRGALHAGPRISSKEISG